MKSFNIAWFANTYSASQHFTSTLYSNGKYIFTNGVRSMGCRVRKKTEVENVWGGFGEAYKEKIISPRWKAMYKCCVPWMHIHWERHADRSVERIQWNAFQKILNEPVFVRSLPLGNTLGCHFSYMRPFLNQIQHTWHYNRKCIGAITTWMSHDIDTCGNPGKKHRNKRWMACKKTEADRSNKTDLSFVQAQNKTE